MRETAQSLYGGVTHTGCMQPAYDRTCCVYAQMQDVDALHYMQKSSIVFYVVNVHVKSRRIFLGLCFSWRVVIIKCKPRTRLLATEAAWRRGWSAETVSRNLAQFFLADWRICCSEKVSHTLRLTARRLQVSREEAIATELGVERCKCLCLIMLRHQ